MARPIAFSSTSSPNGLVKNSTAPAFIACTVVGTSPYPVMKMTGMSARSMRRCWRSRPLRLGSVTSRTRQLGPWMRERSRNSSADSNVSGCQPAERISNSSDSRTDTSSSTTNTTGVSCEITGALDSLPASRGELMSPSPVRNMAAKRGADRIQQGCLAERLDQALHGPAREQTRTDRLVREAGDEHNWNLLPAPTQFLLKVGTRHPWHRDVEEQTAGLADDIRCEERFRG